MRLCRTSITLYSLLLCLLIACAPNRAQAHPLDPTLSVAQLKVNGNQIDCILRGPANEVLIPNNLQESDLMGADTQKTVLAHLTHWLPKLFTLEQDRKPLTPQVVTAEYQVVGIRPEFMLAVHYTADKPVEKLRVTSRLVHTIVAVNGIQFELRGEKNAIKEFDTRPSLMSTFNNVRDFANMGMEHLFSGPDHILFICTLIFALMNFHSVVKMLTGFTVGHSITLVLTTLNVFSVSPRFADMGVALTIIYVGIENIFRKEMPKNRWWLVFCFGLIHGMGFSRALREVGLPEHGLVLCLLSFNLGIEFAQIVIVAAIYPILSRLRVYRELLDAEKGPQQFRTLMNLGSAVTSCVGCYWLIERIFTP